MTITLNGTSGIVNDATSLSYTGTLTGGTGVVNLGSGQVYKDASGNVGIGTASPAAKLDVQTSAGRFQVLPSGGSSISLYAAGGGNIGLDSAGGITLFKQNGTESARIDSSGNLLVGCTAIPSASVKGGALSVDSTATNIYLATNSTSADRLLWFYNPNGLVGGIVTDGSTTSYATSSDYRLKEQVQPMTGALAKVALLKPCTYKWKVDGSDGQGFIAHELAEVEAGCVTGEKDAVDAEGNPQYQGIDTSFLIATLSAAIQELHALVKTQDSTITALNERLTALEAPIV